jgi:hypothetical protein
MVQTVQPGSSEQTLGKLRAARGRWLEAARNKNDVATQTHMTRLDYLLDEYLPMLVMGRELPGGCRPNE